MEIIKLDDQDLKKCYDAVGRRGKAILLYMLMKHVPESYRPRAIVSAMVAGDNPTSLEAEVVESFHKERFGIERKMINLVGCEIHPREDVYGKRVKYEHDGIGEEDRAKIRLVNDPPQVEGYDRKIRCYVESALDSGLWFLSRLTDRNEGEKGFDFIYAGHLRDIDAEDWTVIFKNAMQCLTPAGVLAVTCHGAGEIVKLVSIRDSLESEGIHMHLTTLNYTLSGPNAIFLYGGLQSPNQ